jgi:hypothetical protein
MTRSRTCLHCVLVRALAAEGPALARVGLTVRVRAAPPVTLPRPAAGIYRELRSLLRDAAAGGRPGLLRLMLVDLPGRCCVEVFRDAARATHCR